jgi:hypothetical protein
MDVIVALEGIDAAQLQEMRKRRKAVARFRWRLKGTLAITVMSPSLDSSLFSDERAYLRRRALFHAPQLSNLQPPLTRRVGGVTIR